MSRMSKIGVIGAGHMGSGIAQKLAQEGFNVVLVDINDAFVERGMSTIKGLLQGGVKRAIFTQEYVDKTLARVQGTTDLKAVADADVVIEAVFEDKKVKTDLFRNLDGICSPKTILATNTSSFYVSEFAKVVNRPDRFIGLHYFFHPAKNRLLEIIPHETTSNETLEKALLLAKLHGKTPITVKDSPGFAVNRFFVPFLNESARMLEQEMGNIPTIEEASKRAFGIGMGVFELMNVTGIPLAVHASTSLGNELGPFYQPCKRLISQVAAKTDWDIATGTVDEAKIGAIVDRFYGVCLGVAATLVDEGGATVEDIDLGAKIGLRWGKGPFEIMNRIGIDRTHDVVQAVADHYPDFTMPAGLTRQKALGKPFEFKLVELEVKGDTAFITINRPDAMNALNETVVGQLSKAFTRAQENPGVRGIVFQGKGKAFVAGADIQFFVKQIKDKNIPAIEAFTRKGHELLLAIENSSKKTIALLEGLSLGGGSEMALACQFILATPAGSLGFPETGIGIIPGLGGMFRMERQVGPALARYFVFTGQVLNAQDAHALGIVHRVIQPEEISGAIRQILDGPASEKYRKRSIPGQFQELALVCSNDNVKNILGGKPLQGVADAVKARAEKILARKSPLAIRIAHEIMEKQAPMSIAQAVDYELSQLDMIFNTQDAWEGLSSAGRRKPEFTGK
ncbi:MAG: 3-hydroxyacyl-CoA dehydrogenase NAD-binding domain-containing protein [Pseudomonadota bacterium]